MEVPKLPSVGRRGFCLGIVTLLGLAGCGDETNTPATVDDVKAKEDAERAAREQAYGPGGDPTKTKTKHKH